MKKVLLVATNAGGARNILPLIERLKKSNREPFLITLRNFLSLGIVKDIEIIKPEGIKSVSEALDFVSKIKPQAIISGTTCYQSPERFLTIAAKTKQIRSVVVLDEWFNYRLRFQNNRGELEYLPHAIAVMDKMAKEEAVRDGIARSLCHITGSVSLSELFKKVKGFKIKPPDKPDFIKRFNSGLVFTFISECFASDYGSCKSDTGPLGPFLGYTEEVVKRDIIKVLNEMRKPALLVEKLHPSQKKDFKVIDKGRLKVVTVRDADLHSLLWHSDAVIGMRSLVLLEAAIFNKPTVSYQPGLLTPNQCTAVRLGIIKSLPNINDLKNWCQSSLNKKKMRKASNFKRPSFINSKSSENVLALALN